MVVKSPVVFDDVKMWKVNRLMHGLFMHKHSSLIEINVVSFTCLNAASMARQRAFDPHITPSAYCSPNLMITGCTPPEEKLYKNKYFHLYSAHTCTCKYIGPGKYTNCDNQTYMSLLLCQRKFLTKMTALGRLPSHTDGGG